MLYKPSEFLIRDRKRFRLKENMKELPTFTENKIHAGESHRDLYKMKNISGTMFDEMVKTKAKDELLTPFEALSKVPKTSKKPAYWISSTYCYNQETNEIELTIRQTGVIPNHLQNLTLTVTLSHKSRKQIRHVILKSSAFDNSFKSSAIGFPVNGDVGAIHTGFKVHTKTRFFRRKVASWKSNTVNVSDSPNTQMHRVPFKK